MKQLSGKFGLTVRKAREQRGWSQEVLADRAGLNRSYLGEIERGIAMPSLASIAKLATALDTRMSILVENCESVSETIAQAAAS